MGPDYKGKTRGLHESVLKFAFHFLLLVNALAILRFCRDAISHVDPRGMALLSGNGYFSRI
jgi:hypothetical protein